MTPDLQATLKKLPDRPGVYLMRDARGDVVYVGKAQSLRLRGGTAADGAATRSDPHPGENDRHRRRSDGEKDAKRRLLGTQWRLELFKPFEGWIAFGLGVI